MPLPLGFRASSGANVRRDFTPDVVSHLLTVLMYVIYLYGMVHEQQFSHNLGFHRHDYSERVSDTSPRPMIFFFRTLC